MREIKMNNTSAYLLSELKKNSDQPIREKNIVHELCVKKYSESELQEMKNDLVQRIVGFYPQAYEYIEKKQFKEEFVSISPLTQQFKDELKKAQANSSKSTYASDSEVSNIHFVATPRFC